MQRVSYVVTAAVPEGVVERYVRWLREGHVQAVIAGGAESAEIQVFRGAEGEAGTVVEVVTQYTFASMEAYGRYERETAPTLRAEGIRLFGGSGIAFSRRVGEVAARFGGAA